MSRVATKKYIATMNNYPLFPAGQQVFIKSRRGTKVAVPLGQPVAYDLHTGLSIDETMVATTKKIFFGVAVDTTGNGQADAIQGVAGDQLDPCNIESICAAPATCGVPGVEDLYFKCIPCDKNFNIVVEVMDQHTDNVYPLGRGDCYVIHGYSGICPCDECSPADACEALACSFERSAAGKTCENDPFKYLQPGAPGCRDSEEMPFTLFALRKGYLDYNFCICPQATECDKCEHVSGITGILINGVETPFTNTVDPNNPDLTLTGQLDLVIEGIYDAVEAIGGNVALTSGGGRCCPYQIKINSCVDVQLVGPAGPIAPCDITDPFEGISKVNACKSCDPADEEAMFCCGVRVIAKPVDYECDCYPPNNGKRNLRRNIRVFIGEGSDFEVGSVFTRTIQKPVAPHGTGYIYAQKALKAEQNGRGHKGLRYNISRGNPPLPLKQSKFRQLANIDACENYCGIGIAACMVYKDSSFNGFKNYPVTHTNILIPQSHDVTQASVTGFINAVAALSNCPPIGPISCDPVETCDGTTPFPIELGEVVVEQQSIVGVKVAAKNATTATAKKSTTTKAASKKVTGTKVKAKNAK